MIKPLNMPDSGINYFGASLKLEEGNLIYDYKE